MRTASKVIFAVEDDYSSLLIDALQPNSNTHMQRSEIPFALALEKYGINDQKASGMLVNFSDSQGVLQVSTVLLASYRPPLAACAVYAVLESILAESSSDVPTFFIPVIALSPKICQEMGRSMSCDGEIIVSGIQVGVLTDVANSLMNKVHKSIPPLQIALETLAVLFHFIRALDVPTVILVGSSGEHHGRKTDLVLEAVTKVGEILAANVGLCFFRDKIERRSVSKSKQYQEPWRELYG